MEKHLRRGNAGGHGDGALVAVAVHARQHERLLGQQGQGTHVHPGHGMVKRRTRGRDARAHASANSCKPLLALTPIRSDLKPIGSDRERKPASQAEPHRSRPLTTRSTVRRCRHFTAATGSRIRAGVVPASKLCPYCGRLNEADAARCLNCERRLPAAWELTLARWGARYL